MVPKFSASKNLKEALNSASLRHGFEARLLADERAFMLRRGERPSRALRLHDAHAEVDAGRGEPGHCRRLRGSQPGNGFAPTLQGAPARLDRLRGGG